MVLIKYTKAQDGDSNTKMYYGMFKVNIRYM